MTSPASTSSSRHTDLTHRLRWLAATEWPLVVLDEAQAIKNPGAKQAQAVKTLRARSRVALTGRRSRIA